MLVIGLGGAVIPVNEAVDMTGMSLAVVVGVILNQVFNYFEAKGWMTE
jgi:uracil permease